MLKTLKVAFIAITLLILTLLQVGVIPAVSGGYPHFNLFLCLVAGFSFGGYFSEALGAAFLGGILLDFFTFFPFGLTSLGLVVFSYLCQRIYRALGFRWWALAAACFLFSFLWRVALGFFSFSWSYLWGALEDVFLASFIYLFFIPIWEKIFSGRERQLRFRSL